MLRRISEELTRKEMIDPQLEQAGWYLRVFHTRHLETADLYEPPLDMFGADVVERWFTEKECEKWLSLLAILRSELFLCLIDFSA